MASSGTPAENSAICGGRTSRSARRVEGGIVHEIKLLPLIDIELESSFLVLARNMGIRTRVPTWGVLVLGNPVGPILVDTGASGPEIMERLGMTGSVGECQGLDPQLAEHGLERADIRYLLH